MTTSELLAIATSAATTEDQQLGAMVSAISFIESGMIEAARLELHAVLRAHGHDSPLGGYILRAANWIDLAGTSGDAALVNAVAALNDGINRKP